MGRRMNVATLACALTTACAASPAVAAPATPRDSAAPLGATHVAAQDPKQARTALIEITDTHKGRPTRTVRFVMAVDEHRSSRVQTRDEHSSHTLRLRQRSQQESLVEITLNLDRTTRHGDTDSKTSMSMTSRLRISQRALMGKVQRADGGALQVFVTLK